MKRKMLLICLLSISVCGFSRSFTLRIINNSVHTFYRAAIKVNTDAGLCNGLSNNNDKTKGYGELDNWSHLEPGQINEFKIHDDRFHCGLEGLVEWILRLDNKTYIIHVDFNIPFVGGNDFFYSASYPFVMRHMGGGDGGDVELTFEIYGGPPTPQAAPEPLPPPPIYLPTRGNNAIQGQILWNAEETGLPKRSDEKKLLLDYLASAFKIEVMAPTQFRTNIDGSGKDNYNGSTGYFAEYKKLEHAKITVSDGTNSSPNRPDIARKPLSPVRIIRFTISGLPEQVPVNITLNTKNSDWETGVHTPAKPSAKPDAKWLVFIHEKEKSSSRVEYQVYGAWFSGDGGYSSDLTTTGIISALKKSVTASIFGGMPGNFRRSIHDKQPTTKPVFRKPIQTTRKNN